MKKWLFSLVKNQKMACRMKTAITLKSVYGRLEKYINVYKIRNQMEIYKLIDYAKKYRFWQIWVTVRMTGWNKNYWIHKQASVCVSLRFSVIFILFHCTECLEWPKWSETILKTYLGNSLQVGLKSMLSKLERLWRFDLDKHTKREYLFEPI